MSYTGRDLQNNLVEGKRVIPGEDTGSSPAPRGDEKKPTTPVEKPSPQVVDRGEQLHLIRLCEGGVLTVNISADSRTVLVSTHPPRTRLLDLRTGKDVALPMFGDLSGIATGRSEILAGQGVRPFKLQVYDLKGNLRRVLPLKDQLWNLTVSPRGDRFVYPSPGGDRLIDTLTGKEIKRWPRGKRDSNFSAFSTDGKLVLFQPDTSGPAPEIGKVNVGTVAAKVWKLSPDGKRIAIWHEDRNVRVWDFTTGKELCAFPAFKLDKLRGMSFAISPDNKYACAGGEPGWFYIWRLPEPK
jgi:WD40 repeat protein